VADQVVAIEREVIRRVGPRIDPELVKLAVQFAMENRRPPVVTSGPLPPSLGPVRLK
jgi:hypothetical protein